MNANLPRSPATAISLARERLRQYWRQRPPHERVIIAFCAGSIAIALLYALAWKPIEHGRQRLKTELPGLRLAAGKIRLDAAEALRLKNQTPAAALPTANMRQALLQVPAGQDLGSGPGRLSPDEAGQVKVALTATDFDQWVRWILQTQSQYNVHLHSCRVEALPQPGMVRVETILAGPSQK